MEGKRTLEPLIHQIREHLAPELCSDLYFDQIIQAASQIPALFEAMLEFRINTRDSRVDFGILAVQKRGEFDLLVTFYEGENNLSPEVKKAWNRIIEFCRLSSDQKTFLGSNVNNVWVAYDLGTTTVPIPWIYIGIKPHKGFPELSANQCREILKSYDISISDAHFFKMSQILLRLPVLAQMEAFGYLEIRSMHVLRLIMRSFPTMEEIESFLQDIAFPLDLKQAVKLEPFLAIVGNCQLVLDVGESLLPRIGIEFWIPHHNNYIKSRLVLDQLISQGLCFGELKGLLLDWISIPDRTGNMNPRRWINHFKITIELNKPILVKAYFSFRDEFRNN